MLRTSQSQLELSGVSGLQLTRVARGEDAPRAPLGLGTCAMGSAGPAGPPPRSLALPHDPVCGAHSAFAPASAPRIRGPQSPGPCAGLP